MLDRPDVVYLYDGSFDGLLTAVFEAYARGEAPASVEEADGYQTAFGRRARMIPTEEAKAARVQKGVLRKMGSLAFHKLSVAFLSNEPAKSASIYGYIRLGMKVGRPIHNHIAADAVLTVEKLSLRTEHEAHLFTGFVRFGLLEGGVYYAKINPKANVIPLIMPHFVERYNDQPFIIHDSGRHLAGVYDLRQWQMLESGLPLLPDYAAEESVYRSLWKRFYDTIAIKERYNPLCRRGHMPKRYWSGLTEMIWREGDEGASYPLTDTPSAAPLLTEGRLLPENPTAPS